MGPLSRGLQQTSAQVHRFSTATRGVFQQLDSNINTVNSALQRNTAQFGLWAAAGTILFMRLIRGTLDFQRELVLLGTFLKDDMAGGLGTVNQQLARFRKEIISIAKETGRPFVDLTRGLSALIQVGIPGEEALVRLGAAAKFATITGADVSESVAAIVKIMHTFGMTTEQTEEFFGKLFKAIDIAPVPAKEFLDAFVGVATAAGQVNASLDDALTLFTQVSFKTDSAAKASTIAARAFELFGKHGIKAGKIAKEQGVAYDSNTLAIMGLANWLASLRDISDETIGVMTEEKRARIAVAEGVRHLNDFLAINQKIAASTAETLGQKFNFVMGQTPLQIDQVKASILALRDKMVDATLVAITPMVHGLEKLFEALEKIPGAVHAVILGFSGLTIAGTGIFFLVGMIGKLASNFLMMGGFMLHAIHGLFPFFSKGLLTASTHAWRLGGTASTLTLRLRKLGNQFAVLAFAPGLAARAIQKFANLSKEQAGALAVYAMQVRRKMMGINQAAAALAPTLGVTTIEAKKMITTMKGGALALPPPTIFQKAWRIVATGVKGFGNALLHPIAALGTLGGVILKIVTTVVPRFIGALRIVMSFFGPLGWVIMGIVTILSVAFPGSLSRLATIFIETLKLMFTLAKVVFHGIGIAFSAATTTMSMAWEGFIGLIPDVLKNFVRLIQNTVIKALDWIIERLREARKFWEFFISEAPAGLAFAETVGKRAISAQELISRAQRAGIKPEAVEAGLRAKRPVISPEGKPVEGLYRVQIKGLGNVLMKQEQLNIAAGKYTAIIEEQTRKERDRTAEALKEADKRLDAYRKELTLKTVLLEEDFAEIFKLVQGDTKMRTEALRLYRLARTKAEIEDEKRRQEVMDNEELQERLRLYERLAEIDILARTEQESLLMRAAAYKAYQDKLKEIDDKRFKETIEPLLKYVELQEEAARLVGDINEERFFATQRISLEGKKAEKETGSAIAGTIAIQKGTIELEDKRLERVMKRAEKELETGKKVVHSMDEEDEARRKFIEEARAALKIYSAELEKIGLPPEAIEGLDKYQEVLRAIAEETAVLEDRSTGVFDAIVRGFEDAQGKGIKYLERLRGAAKEVIENIRTTLSDTLFDWITGELDSLGDVFRNFLRGILRAISDFIAAEAVRKLIEIIFGKEKKAEEKVTERTGGLIEKIGEIIFGKGKGEEGEEGPVSKGPSGGQPIEEGIQGILGDLNLEKIFGQLKSSLGGIFDKLKGGLGSILASIGGMGGMEGILGGMGKGIGGILGSIAKFLPFLPLQEGGIVKSPVLGMLGEKGPEAVIPLDRMGTGMGSIQFNINTLDGANLHDYLRRNADILSSLIQSELLHNKNLRKTIIRMG